MQATKFVNLTPPGALVDGASLTVAELDTLNWDYAQIVLILGATDIACTAAILTDGDTSGSGHANIAASNFSGQTNLDGGTAALPTATDDDGFFVWELDLRKRKRYIDATITVGDGTVGGYYTVIAILSRGDNPPTTISGRGCTDIIRI
jgi:hypothetical protein